MTRIDGLSPLSTRDPNRELSFKGKSRAEAIDVDKIKARFDSDFLPKYGDLWRRIIREKEKREAVSDNCSPNKTDPSSFEPTLPNPRALDFLEAIERKQAVSISAEQECECPPPIVEFVDLNEEQTRHVTMNREKRRSFKSQDNPSEPNNSLKAVGKNTECAKAMSDEETETEVDEGDSQSVYATADEFEEESDEVEHNKFSTLFAVKENSIATKSIKNIRNGQNNENDSGAVIIDIGSDSDDMKDDTSKVVNLRNGATTYPHRVHGNYKRNTFAVDASKLRISTKEKDAKDRMIDPIIDTGKSTCLSPRLDVGIPSSSNEISVDTDNEADDEHDTESEYEEDDEAEWLPDDDSMLSRTKSKPPPNRFNEKRKAENRTINQTMNLESESTPKHIIDERKEKEQLIHQTIDLCDTSSSDDAVDTDFTVSTDEEESLDTEEQIVQAVVCRKAGKGRSKASFRRNREQITASTLDEFNRKAFGGKLGKVVVQWSKKLNTTAGLTRLQKLNTDMTPGVPLKRLATIELSTKVVDDEEKLRTTLLHELVHAAVWIFEGVSRPPHGADFKRWAKIAMSKVPDVIVTTTHSYQIQYKFNWACVNPKCSFTIGRHSRSVDLIRHRCGKCRGKLIEVTPDGAPKKQAQPSAYNLFVKKYSKAVREQLVKRKPGVTQAEVMKELGRLWREQKDRGTTSASVDK